MHDAGWRSHANSRGLKKVNSVIKIAGLPFYKIWIKHQVLPQYLNPGLDKNEYILVAISTVWEFISRWLWLIIVWLFYLRDDYCRFENYFLRKFCASFGQAL